MTRFLWLAAICCALLTAGGCKRTSKTSDESKPSNIKIEPHLHGDGPPTVLFDIKRASRSPRPAELDVYDCTYVARGKTAKFRLLFKQNSPMSGDVPVAGAEGKFMAVPGSENAALLEDLRTALDAKAIPAGSARIAELSFDAAILGQRQSRNPTGGFSNNPPGDWIAIKIFLPKGGDDGEVFLNLNPVLGKGEFSIKDSDYGDYLLGEFAKIL